MHSKTILGMAMGRLGTHLCILQRARKINSWVVMAQNKQIRNKDVAINVARYYPSERVGHDFLPQATWEC